MFFNFAIWVYLNIVRDDHGVSQRVFNLHDCRLHCRGALYVAISAPETKQETHSANIKVKRIRFGDYNNY